MLPVFIKEKIKTLKKRPVLEKIKKYLDMPEIIVFLGMRQTGKTSLLYLTTQLLLKKGIPDSNLFYFSLEDPTLLSSFNQNIKELEIFLKTQKINKKFKTYILIDEIQYLENPSNFLKYYADNFPELKFIVTGSSTFQIKKKFKDSLAGRKKSILIKPLDFREFLYFKKQNLNINFNIHNLDQIKNIQISKIIQENIQEQFREYLLFGGHPKIPLLPSKELKIEELQEIYNDYIRKDIKDLAKIENLDAYNSLIQILASQIGNLFNVIEISNTINLNHITLKKYLFLLENSFVVNLLKPYFQNKRKEISKMPKIYLEDTGIHNIILSDFKQIKLRSDIGQIVENFVFNELDKNKMPADRINFWRTTSKQEVDFIYQTREGLIIPIEVKYKSFENLKIPSGIKSFVNLYHAKKAIVITKDFYKIIKYKETEIYFIPVWLI